MIPKNPLTVPNGSEGILFDNKNPNIWKGRALSLSWIEVQYYALIVYVFKINPKNSKNIIRLHHIGSILDYKPSYSEVG